MTDLKSTGSNFFNKNTQHNLPVHATPASAFRNIFDVQNLDENEGRQIEKLLVEDFQPNPSIAENAVPQDVALLKNITAEIKSIKKQEILLIGERVFKAREILKNYGDGRGAFTKWLLMTFGSRSSGYNSLNYYEFYQALPDAALQSQLKKMPHKAVYMLASRKGSIDTKAEIIRTCHTEKAENILPIIQDKLPAPEDRRTKKLTASQTAIRKLDQDVRKLMHRKEHLNSEDKKHLQKIADAILSILQPH